MDSARTTIGREGNLAPSKKPKRPLSAFNLFYRFKRQKVLDAISRGKADKADIVSLVEASPGLEHYSRKSIEDASPQAQVIDNLRRNNIRKDLEHNLLPRDTRDRSHRKNQGAMNGAMSFLELGKLMNTSWKKCDDFAKSVFNELSEEGREHYRLRLKEYNASNEGLLQECAKASSTKQNKSNKKKGAGKASSGPTSKNGDTSDDGSSMNETAEAKHLRQPMFHANDNILTSVNNGAVPPSLLDLMTNGDNQVMRMATVSLRSVSKDYSASQEIEPPHDNPKNDNQANLMLRVRELEGQLAAERLRGRVRELESLLGRQQSVEDQLRAQLGVLSRNAIRAPPLPAVVNHPPPMQDGLWPLVSASMIHPSVQASESAERAAVLSRMVAARQQHRASSLQHVMPQYPYMQESERATSRRWMDLDYDDSSNKRQRRN